MLLVAFKMHPGTLGELQFSPLVSRCRYWCPRPKRREQDVHPFVQGQDKAQERRGHSEESLSGGS